ncbi:Gfo/Idh/MocA family protein [Frigoribacterium sp. 2-23]|uniref:Gfo/Idh/MocA family protein n=1 Tax=Frigoribacterium sp. 2-23 TaxID=3415006 RepID=UPI003C700DC0
MSDRRTAGGAGRVDHAPLRSAVVGLGDISALHLDALSGLPDVELVAVCDVDADRLATAVAPGGPAEGATPFADWSTMLDEAGLDVLHVCLPHHLHAPVAIDALERGVHVLTEKPVADSNAAADALLAAAEASSAMLGVCFQNRYNEPVLALRRLLDEGELGTPTAAAATVIWHRTSGYYAAAPWRGAWATAGGGLLMNQAIHTLDLAQWLLGDVVGVEGHAATRRLGDVIEVEDTAEMLLTHESGVTTAFYATLAHGRNSPVELEIVTDTAVARLRDDLVVTYADGRELTVAAPVAEGARSYWGVSHAALITDFYDAVAAGRPFWIDGPEAAKTLRTIQSVYDTSFPDRVQR